MVLCAPHYSETGSTLHVSRLCICPPPGLLCAGAQAYAYYEDAFWITKLNKTEGEFPADPFVPLYVAAEGIFIGIHWNDGPFRCTTNTTASANSAGDGAHDDDDGGAINSGMACHGFLEVYYSVTNDTFFYGVSSAPLEPFGLTSDPATLGKLHSAVLEAIAPVLNATGVDPKAIAPPSKLVVGEWARKGGSFIGAGYTAPTKVYWAPSVSGSLAAACRVDGLTDDEFRQTVLQVGHTRYFVPWDGRERAGLMLLRWEVARGATKRSTAHCATIEPDPLTNPNKHCHHPHPHTPQPPHVPAVWQGSARVHGQQ